MKLATYSIAAVLAGSASFAGGYNEPVAEPTPVPAVVATPVDGDWTGFYAGLQYGQADAEVSFAGVSASDDFDAYGIHAGYLHDFGQYVLGAELGYDDVEDADLIRLRGRAGLDAGKWLPYVTLGVARVSGDVEGEDISETGITYGVGVDYQITDAFLIGAEFSRSTFEDVFEGETGVSGIDLDADVIQVRASFRF